MKTTLYNAILLLFCIAILQNSTAQTAFAKAKDLKFIKETTKYTVIANAINRGKRVPRWINTLGKEDRNTMLQTALFFDAPFSPDLRINQVRPQRFIEIIDIQLPKDTIGEDLMNKDFSTESVTLYDDFSANRSYTTVNATGLASPSVIIDGTAKFLVKRTKQELEIAFFEEFRHKIEKDTLLPFLLPETHRLLRYQDYYQVPAMGKIWTTAFENDLRQVPLHLEEYIRIKQPQLMDTTALFVFSMAINCMNQVSEGTKIPLLLERLTRDYAFIDTRNNLRNKQIYNGFEFLNIISTELLASTEKDKEFKWIMPQEFKELQANGQQFFWTVVYRQYKAFFDKNIGEIKNTKQFDASYRIISELIDTYNKMNSTLNIYNENTVAAKALGLSEQVLRGTELVVRLDTLFNKNHSNRANFYYKNIFPTTATALSILIHAEKKEYGAMSLQTVKFMEQTLTPLYGKRAPEHLKTFFFYMNFMVDMMTADNSTATSDVIERYALPPQSYRMKRYHDFSLSLNAYPGILIGREQTLNADNQINIDKWGTIGGVTAPIGFSINSGKKGKNQDISVSLFVPIIDLGAAFSYRWSNTASGFPDNIKWSQVFAPGAYLMVGVPRTPVSVSLGTQLTPKLRSITTNSTTITNNTLRWCLNAAVDIPFLNLYKRLDKIR